SQPSGRIAAIRSQPLVSLSALSYRFTLIPQVTQAHHLQKLTHISHSQLRGSIASFLRFIGFVSFFVSSFFAVSSILIIFLISNSGSAAIVSNLGLTATFLIQFVFLLLLK
ncbi:transmembrane protein, putative, partial [Medicago truncatula]